MTKTASVMETNGKILGVWTPEAFRNAVIFAAVVAVTSFFVTLLYKYTLAYLET